MKVRIPPKVKFMTHIYDVEFNPKRLASVGCGGLTQHLYQKITLDNDVNPKSELDQIFLHEYIHIIERHTGMKLDDMDVERLSEGISVLLFDSLGIEFDWSEIK